LLFEKQIAQKICKKPSKAGSKKASKHEVFDARYSTQGTQKLLKTGSTVLGTIHALLTVFKILPVFTRVFFNSNLLFSVLKFTLLRAIGT
jgi:hypothetical protein